MCRYRTATTVLLLFTAYLLNGCSLLNPAAMPASGSHSRQEAVARWSRCLERFIKVYNGSVQEIGQHANDYCEGHRRDVVATYPAHLANQIDSLLSERAHTTTMARVVRTTDSDTLSDTWDEPEASQLDTMRTWLREARQSDL